MAKIEDINEKLAKEIMSALTVSKILTVEKAFKIQTIVLDNRIKEIDWTNMLSEMYDMGKLSDNIKLFNNLGQALLDVTKLISTISTTLDVSKYQTALIFYIPQETA